MYISSSTQTLYYSSMQQTGSTPTVYNDTTSTQLSSAVTNNQTSDGVTKYDFTNMTKSQMRETVNKLIKSGQMTLDESSSLVGIMGDLPQVSADGTYYTPDTSNQKIDFIAALKQSIDFNQSIGNISGITYDNKALTALEKLQSKASSINLSV